MTMMSTAAGWVATDETFGARLALVRQRMGWGNVKEAALACGIPVQSWRGWERDGRQPRDYLETCRKIADETGCDLLWLTGLERPAPVSRDTEAGLELPRLDSNQQPSGFPIHLVNAA